MVTTSEKNAQGEVLASGGDIVHRAVGGTRVSTMLIGRGQPEPVGSTDLKTVKRREGFRMKPLRVCCVLKKEKAGDYLFL